MNNKNYHNQQLESGKRLDELNLKIWEYGFNSIILSELGIVAKEINDGRTLFERIPQEQLSGLSARYGFLCQAAVICRGCPLTKSEFREIYRTEDLIGEGKIQETLIEQWARLKGIWFDDPEYYLSKISHACDDGTESKVFFDVSNELVRKLISLKNYNVVRLALDRIIIHNAIFPASPLVVKGFGRNSDDDFVVVAEQPYIRGRGVSEQERLDFMTALGFEEAGEDYGMHLNYKTPTIYIGDLNEFNVLKGESGIQVIDADCRLNVKSLGCGGSYVIPQPGFNRSAFEIF